MPYVQFEVSDSTKLRIQQKFIELQETLITDEFLEEIFRDNIKGVLRQAVNESIQRSELKNALVKKSLDHITKAVEDVKL